MYIRYMILHFINLMWYLGYIGIGFDQSMSFLALQKKMR